MMSLNFVINVRIGMYSITHFVFSLAHIGFKIVEHDFVNGSEVLAFIFVFFFSKVFSLFQKEYIGPFV